MHFLPYSSIRPIIRQVTTCQARSHASYTQVRTDLGPSPARHPSLQAGGRAEPDRAPPSRGGARQETLLQAGCQAAGQQHAAAGVPRSSRFTLPLICKVGAQGGWEGKQVTCVGVLHPALGCLTHRAQAWPCRAGACARLGLQLGPGLASCCCGGSWTQCGQIS